MLPSVFLIEMFDLRGKELKHAKELFLNHYRKSVQNSMRLQGMLVAGHVGRVKTVVTNHLSKMFRSHTQGTRTQYSSQDKFR